MEQQDLPAPILCLEPAIDPRPLTVDPDTPLLEAIAMMSKAYSSCVLPSLGVPLDTVLMSEARASAIIVTQESHLLGIFTQTEALQVIADGRNLAELRIDQVMSQPAIALTQSDAQDIFTALSLLRQHQKRHLPIVDAQGKLVGLVTPASIRQVLQVDELLKSRELAEVISTPVFCAPAIASALSLAQLMAEHQVDCVVLTEGDSPDDMQPLGMITERDIIQLMALELDLSQIQAQSLMSIPLLCLSPSKSVLAAYWEMQQQCVQRFVVSDSPEKLLGIVTATSFLQTLDLTDMSSAVEQLQRSISQFKAEKVESQNRNDVPEPHLLENPAELLEQLKCSRLLTAMSLGIRESLNLDEILNRAVDEVRQFLQTERVIIYRFNADLSGTVVVESVASGWQPALNSTISDTCFGKNYAQSYKQGRTQVVEDIYTAGLSQCHIDILVLYDIRASLVVPILQGEHLWGLFCAYHCSEPRYWRPFEIDLLKQLATHMAIAIQQSELYQQVQMELESRKRAEEQLKVSLKEKELLLKEVHHRVKNNLQIISSLLRLQSDYIKDEKALASFKDSQNRIRSMALIHEKLYQSKDLFRIDFAEYIRDLTGNLLRSYTARSQAITLRINAKDIWLNLDTAISCGLIINELVSNSLKHAFTPANPENRIEVNIHSSSNNKFILTVRDNGVGFPQDLDFQDTESLGLQLVCTFIEQLEGTIELDRSQGTTFTMKFSEVGLARRVQ